MKDRTKKTANGDRVPLSGKWLNTALYILWSRYLTWKRFRRSHSGKCRNRAAVYSSDRSGRTDRLSRTTPDGTGTVRWNSQSTWCKARFRRCGTWIPDRNRFRSWSPAARYLGNRTCASTPIIVRCSRYRLRTSRVESRKRTVILYTIIPQLPPVAVVAVFRRDAFENVPPPEVHQISERQEHDFVQSDFVQVIDVGLVRTRRSGQQTDLVQVLRSGHGQSYRVSDRFVETCF